MTIRPRAKLNVEQYLSKKGLPLDVRSAASSVAVAISVYEIYISNAPKLPPIIFLRPGVSELTTPLVAPGQPTIITGQGPGESTVRGKWSDVFAAAKGTEAAAFAYVIPMVAHQLAVRNVRLENFVQDIAGIDWVNVKFVHSVIRFHGGSLYLSGVSFEDCQFDFGSDETSVEVLDNIRAASGTPISLTLEPRLAP